MGGSQLAVVIGIIAVATVSFMLSRYRRCPSDRILVVYGSVGRGKSAKCVHGGGTYVLPLFQDSRFLSLTPMTIPIDLKNALSLQNIRIDVPSTFTVGISTHPMIMTSAAERLLGLAPPQIEAMAREIIFGQLRLTIASLTIEDINSDREKFLESIRQNVEPELNKIGLYLINVNITDITDESNYITSIGQKAAATAVNQAKVDVAEQLKSGAIGESNALREREIRVAQNVAESEKGQKAAEADRRVFVQQQEAEAVKGENEAKASVAAYEAELSVRTAEADQAGRIAEQQAKTAIAVAHAEAETARRRAEQIVAKEIEKEEIEISAAAYAERVRREAQGQADATLATFQAEAEGTLRVLEGKAEGYRKLIEACNGDAQAAATLLMVEKLEAVVAEQVKAISQLQIDKITVWDNGGQGAGQGGTTSNFLSGMLHCLPPLHEMMRMAGVELPEYLGRIADQARPEPALPAD